MKRFNVFIKILSGLSLFLIIAYAGTYAQQSNENQNNIAIVIHGGAGTISKTTMTPEMEREYREKLTEAIMAGYNILGKGGSAIDAVEATIRIMEDSPLFNAGKGAVFTHEGKIEMDASIMDGKNLNAGAVAAVRHIKNPISLARMVMDKSWHVLLTGEGAETFARDQGMELMPEEYFRTERRWNQLQRMLKENAGQDDSIKLEKKKNPLDIRYEGSHGTVGCVALDRTGNLAAGTSTGGMTNKRFGRVGDSPIIGAGNYANNKTCAVSGTGDGEYFIRLSVGKDISDLMEYKGLSVKEAAERVIVKLGNLGGTGGVIALDSKGNIAMPFNTSGMYRAYVDKTGNPVVLIYKE